MIDSLQQTKSKPLQLTVERGGKTLTFNVAPELADTPGAPEKHYRMGFRNSYETKVTQLSLPDAFSHSLADNKRYSVILLQLVGKLIQRKASPDMFSGPIGIAQQTGEAAREQGWTPLLGLCAAIVITG